MNRFVIQKAKVVSVGVLLVSAAVGCYAPEHARKPTLSSRGFAAVEAELTLGTGMRSGRFTLLMRREDRRMRIVYDHTSEKRLSND